MAHSVLVLAVAVWLLFYGSYTAIMFFSGLMSLVIGALQLAIAIVAVPLNAFRSLPLLTPETAAELAAYPMNILPFFLICGGLVALNLARRFGQRLNRVRRDEILLENRPPVLLLRSFGDDNSGITPSHIISRLFWRKKRLEECLGAELDSAGPYIAIGKPGEALPPLGAQRVYLTDDTWQAVVRSYIEKSHRIVLIAGTTHWVRWELASILDQRRIDRLIIVFPRTDGDERARRWDHLKGVFERTTWNDAAQRADVRQGLAVIASDQGLVIIKSSGARQSDYEIAIRVAAHILGAGGISA